MINSRKKGHDFERYLVHRFRELYPEVDGAGNHEVTRGLGQAREASVSDVVTPEYWVEAKRGRKVNIHKAMEQAKRDLDKAPSVGRKTPIVVSKNDHAEILVTLPFEDWLRIEQERRGIRRNDFSNAPNKRRLVLHRRK